MKIFPLLIILSLVIIISGCTQQTIPNNNQGNGGIDDSQQSTGNQITVIPTSDLEYWNNHKDEYTQVNATYFTHSGHTTPTFGNVGTGWKSGYHLIVQGDATHSVGERMEGGTITVLGKTENNLGERMEGGTITVHGDLDYTSKGYPIDNAGTEMVNGIIIIKGYGGQSVGYKMMGGSIIVEGNAGSRAGYLMEGGRITIKGDASSGLGFRMKDGTIIVEGNAGSREEASYSGSESFGYEMEGGSLTINGKAFLGVGSSMKGGTITVNCEGVPEGEACTGTVGTEMSNGKIYIKGKAGSILSGMSGPVGGEIWEYWGTPQQTRIYPN